MPQQYADSHQASEELEAPPANLQVVNPMDSLWTQWTVCEHRHLSNDVRSVETSETYVLGNTIQ